jgi:DNA-binding transcriptional ArsR family regulator
MCYALLMDAVAGALADPIRRSILLMLRKRGATAGWIAGQFTVSRPAISRHLRVLREAKLVEDVADGRKREYRLTLDALAELESFLVTLRQPVAAGRSSWERRLDALETEVARVRKRRRARPTKSTRRKTA